MSKVKMNLAISLDGYISRLDGSVDYLGESTDKDATDNFNAFLDSIDTIIMGRSSFDKMKEFGEYPFKTKETYIVTSQDIQEKGYTFITLDEIEEVLSSEKNIWLFGGARLVQYFNDNDLVDEYIVTIVPELIGSGIPLFLQFKNDIHLELKDSKIIGEFITLTYIKK